MPGDARHPWSSFLLATGEDATAVVTSGALPLCFGWRWYFRTGIAEVVADPIRLPWSWMVFARRRRPNRDHALPTHFTSTARPVGVDPRHSLARLVDVTSGQSYARPI